MDIKFVVLFVIVQSVLVLGGGDKDVDVVVLNFGGVPEPEPEPEPEPTVQDRGKFFVGPFMTRPVKDAASVCEHQSAKLATPANQDELAEMFDAAPAFTLIKFVLTGFKYEGGDLVDKDGISPSFSTQSIPVVGTGNNIILTGKDGSLVAIRKIGDETELMELYTIMCQRN